MAYKWCTCIFTFRTRLVPSHKWSILIHPHIHHRYCMQYSTHIVTSANSLSTPNSHIHTHFTCLTSSPFPGALFSWRFAVTNIWLSAVVPHANRKCPQNNPIFVPPISNLTYSSTIMAAYCMITQPQLRCFSTNHKLRNSTTQKSSCA